MRQLRHLAMRVLAGLEPIVVYAPDARLGLQCGNGLQRQRPIQPLGKLLLTAAGHQEVPEGAKAAALIRVADRIALSHDFVEQRALGAFPQRDLLPHLAVEPAEVVLHLPEVGQQLPRQLLELQEAVLDRRLVHERHVARQYAGDLGIELVALPAQLGSSRVNSVSRRASVPTTGRSLSDNSRAMAFSVAGVRSNCASSVPGL